ncbi:MAG: GNAT family N-acetyltransferase [Burkholderiales bacterium PBB2]|nr:MAG: GNAT family N-acetyltransferase [Burkholderiales bacterium PBB2]
MALSEAWGPMASGRLFLRAPVATDLEVLHQIQADPLTQRVKPGPVSRQASLELLQSWQLHWQRWGYGCWAMSLGAEAGDELLGFGGLMWQSVDGRQHLCLKLWLHPRAWGLGYATEMGQQALTQAFQELHASAVLALVRPTDLPTRRTLERLGMRLKGALADLPGQAPSLLFEMTPAHLAHLAQSRAQASAAQPAPPAKVSTFGALSA